MILMLIIFFIKIGNCRSMTILTVRSNLLSQLPKEIEHITHLKVLNVSSNRLKRLPCELEKLRELQALWLVDNQVRSFYLFW